MENAEINTEINGRERRNTLPHVYGLRWIQLLSQLWSKAVDLQVNAWNLRQNAPNTELFNFLFYGNMWEALIREDLEGEKKEKPWIP